MRKISDITSYTDDNDEFTDGDIPSGLKPTPLLAEWFNVIQRELVNVVESAGLELDKADDEQLWKALVKYFASGEDLDNSISALGTMAKQNDSAVDINGGTVDGVVIGGESPSSGAFTTLTASQGITGNVTGNLTGNASTATKLQTARSINGVSFDGSTDITIPVMGAATQVRLGAVASYIPSGNEISWTQNLGSGNVMTGIIVQDTGSNSADNIGGIYYRQVQYYVDGVWVSASSA